MVGGDEMSSLGSFGLLCRGEVVVFLGLLRFVSGSKDPPKKLPKQSISLCLFG